MSKHTEVFCVDGRQVDGMHETNQGYGSRHHVLQDPGYVELTSSTRVVVGSSLIADANHFTSAPEGIQKEKATLRASRMRFLNKGNMQWSNGLQSRGYSDVHLHFSGTAYHQKSTCGGNAPEQKARGVLP
jgi:hypothetical protein